METTRIVCFLHGVDQWLKQKFNPSRWLAWVLCLTLGVGLLSGCSLPRISAESRLFLNLSLTPIAQFSLLPTPFQDAAVGGFVALTYDPNRDRFYALADDAHQPKIYTLALNLDTADRHQGVTVEAVTPLPAPSTAEAEAPAGRGIVLTRNHSFFLALAAQEAPDIPPRLREFQPSDGDWNPALSLPPYYWPSATDRQAGEGIDPQQGLKALTLSAEGDRLFTATEAPLRQDMPNTSPNPVNSYSRLLHYWIGEPEPILVAEHLYPLDSPTARLRDLVVLDQAGHFLSLERDLAGHPPRLYQLETGVATDTSNLRTLPFPLTKIVPILKQPLWQGADPETPLPDFAGMTLGARLKNGDRSLVLISNNHGEADVPTQLWVFRLQKRPPLA